MADEPPRAYVRARPDRVGLLLVAGAASMWGTWSLFLRPTHLDGTVAGPLVFALMGLMLLPSALRSPAAHWDRTAIGLLAASTVLDALNVVTFFAALERTTVAVATLTHYLTPILIALSAPRVEGERERVPGAIAWAAVASAGLLLVLAPWQSHGPILVGAVLGSVSAVCYAGNVFVVRRLAPRIGADRAVSYHALAGAVLLAPLALPHEGEVGGAAFARIAIGSLFLGSIAGTMFVRGLARVGSSRAAVLTFAEPVVAVGCGWLVWGEELGPTAAVGAALIVAAGVGVSRAQAAR
jgi:drug/metabolite transporter (DMT)-like permease